VEHPLVYMLNSEQLEVLEMTYSTFETKAYFAGNLETNAEHSEDLKHDSKIWAEILRLKKLAEEIQAAKLTVAENTVHVKCDGTAKSCENVKQVTSLQKDIKALNVNVARLETQVKQHIQRNVALQVGRDKIITN
jgi:hypothetical protein